MDWTTGAAIVTATAATIAVMNSLGRGFAWLGHRFGQKFSLAIRSEIAEQLHSSEGQIVERVCEAILDPHRLSRLSKAFAESVEFQAIIRETVRRAIGYPPHRVNGISGAD